MVNLLYRQMKFLSAAFQHMELVLLLLVEGLFGIIILIIVSCGKPRNRQRGDTMERITKEQVKHVANLSRLELSDDEVVKFAKQLDEIIDYAEQLNELDTDNIVPTAHVLEVKNVMRKDEVRPSIDRDDTFKNAPDHVDGQYKVPRIIE